MATSMVTLRTKMMDTSLWNLLHETRHLLCEDSLDKVYALLSVATEGCEGIEADYQASVCSLGHHVLRNKHAINPPSTLQSVVADCRVLETMVPRLDMLSFHGHGSHLTWSKNGDQHQYDKFWHRWVSLYGHLEVAKLLPDCYPLYETSQRSGKSECRPLPKQSRFHRADIGKSKPTIAISKGTRLVAVLDQVVSSRAS